jgi:glycosyltransferase involved in cell wall biosynthesis
MKILYIITKSTEGGAQTHISQLSKNLKEEGHEVAVMSHPGGWLEDITKKNGIKYYPNIFLSNSLNIFKGLKAKKEIKKAIKEFNPDLVSLHSSAAGLWGRLAAKRKIKTIFTAHGWSFTEGVPFLRKRIAILVERFISKYADKVICVSEFDESLSHEYNVVPKDKILTIHNGVEIGEKTERKYEAPLRIIFIGRLATAKNPMMLIESFNELPDDLKNKAEVILVGGGAYGKEKVEKYISENDLNNKVKLLGSLPRNEVFEQLEKSHIFALTSNWEGFPRSILEAMSFSLPIITTDVGGVKESVTSECGFVIPRNDKEKLKEVLTKLLNDTNLIKSLGDKARERVENNFSLDELIRRTKEIYNLLLEK